MSETLPKNTDSVHLLAVRNLASGKNDDGFDSFLDALRARSAEVTLRELNQHTTIEK